MKKDAFRGVSKDKVQCLNLKFLERISRNVISDMFVDVSKDKTLFALLNCPLCPISRIFQGEVLSK